MHQNKNYWIYPSMFNLLQVDFISKFILYLILTAATVSRSNTRQQYRQAFALPYFDMHSSRK